MNNTIRTQNLLSEYNKRQGIKENNERVFKEVVVELKSLLEQIPSETAESIFSFNPSLLETLRNDELYKFENIQQLKHNVDFVIDEIITNLEGMM